VRTAARRDGRALPVRDDQPAGDLWAAGEPDWRVVLREPRAKLHLYGKSEARAGRKMGHFTVLGDDADATLATATALQSRLIPTADAAARSGTSS